MYVEVTLVGDIGTVQWVYIGKCFDFWRPQKLETSLIAQGVWEGWPLGQDERRGCEFRFW